MSLFKEEEEKDNMIESLILKKKIKSTKPLFLMRVLGGFFEKSI